MPSHVNQPQYFLRDSQLTSLVHERGEWLELRSRSPLEKGNKEEAKGKGVDGVSVEERAREQSLLEDFGQTDERREFLEGNGNGEMDLLIG